MLHHVQGHVFNRINPIRGLQPLQAFLSLHFDAEQTLRGFSAWTISFDSQNYKNTITKAIGLYAELFPLSFAQGRGFPLVKYGDLADYLKGRTEEEEQGLLSRPLLLSFRSKGQICRDLFRLQLYRRLFHQPRDGSYSVSDKEERFVEQEYSWIRYEWWEVKCVDQVMILALEVSPPTQISTESAEEVFQASGLPQLRHFLDQTRRPTIPKQFLFWTQAVPHAHFVAAISQHSLRFFTSWRTETK